MDNMELTASVGDDTPDSPDVPSPHMLESPAPAGGAVSQPDDPSQPFSALPNHCCCSNGGNLATSSASPCDTDSVSVV